MEVMLYGSEFAIRWLMPKDSCRLRGEEGADSWW